MELDSILDTRSEPEDGRILDSEPRISGRSVNESPENQSDDESLLDSGPGLSALSITESSENEQGEKAFCLKKILESYCKLISKYPWATFVLTLTGHVILIIITVILLFTGYTIFPIYFKNIPMELYNVPYKLRSDAWNGRKSYDNSNVLFLYNEYIERSLVFQYLSILLYYEVDDDTIFTKTKLKKIRQIENEITSLKGFTEYCAVIDRAMTCRKPKSVLRFFDGTYAKYNPIFNDTNFDNIPAVLYEAYTNNSTKHDFEFILPKTFMLSDTSSHAKIIRSKVALSIPAPKGNQSWHVMERETKSFMHDIMKPLLWNFNGNVKEFNFYFLSLELLFDDLEEQTSKDLYFAAGSLCFIFLFMLIHTRSLWITFWAVFSICTSYLGTNIIYRCVIGYKYFGYFQVMVIFIILGIGADDLFVFYDTWRLTSHNVYGNLSQRLFDCYSKSMSSMFITSLTTAVAFFISAISPLLATRSFGIFSGILVLFNYISVFIFFPTVVAVHHLKLKTWKSICFPILSLFRKYRRWRRTSSENNVLINDTEQDNISTDNINVQSVNEFHDNNIDTLPNTTPLPSPRTQKESKLVVFFRDYYFHFISEKYVRWSYLILFCLIVVFFSYQASRIEPDNEQLQFFRDSHNYAKARSWEHNDFLQDDPLNYVILYIVWGLKENDRSTCDFTSVECKGEEVFDDSFDPNIPKNQMALKSFCQRLLNITKEDVERLRIKRNPKTKKPEIACFTHNMESFFERKERQYGVHSIDLGLPWDFNKTHTFMKSFPIFYPTVFNSSYKYFLDIPVQLWMLNGYTFSSSRDHQMFYELIGEQRTEFSQELLGSKYYYYGNRLKYIATQVNTTINVYHTSFAEGIPVVESWEDFVNSEMSKMPPGLQNGFQLTFFEWHWFYVQKSLATNAILGVTLGILLAFPIITLATGNVIIGFCATLSICFTTVCVIGVIPFAGWKLGVLVSLNLCLVVGMSVDYVVHLAEGYHLSPHKDRVSRTRDMLEAMGSPVISGAFTTLGASAFMFFAQIKFALQFGTFIFCNIGFSLLFSLGFFTTFMGIFGPENDSGSLKSIYTSCKKRYKKWRKY